MSVYRLDILLDASKLVIDAVPEARFRLIGAGPDIGKIRQMALNLGVNQSIELFGFIPHTEVAARICESEVCVQMTNDTCLGMKVMEYMASRKPIVMAASWWDEYESVIKSGYNCITVPVDPGALATAVVEVMQDRDYAAKLGNNAYETARHYSWNNVSEALMEEVRTLIERPGTVCSLSAEPAPQGSKHDVEQS
jgi:glycosyltransferase involved in cell wall biosynthesis